MTVPLILADLDDILQGLLPIIFAVLYGIAHLVGALQQDKRKAKPRQRARPPQAEGAGANAMAGDAAKRDNLEDSLRREVEQFLRRAQGQPQSQPVKAKPNPPQPRSQPRQVADRSSVTGTSRQPSRPEERPQPRRLVETVRVEPTSAPLEPLRQSIGAPPLSSGSPRHTGDPLRTQGVTQRAQLLGSEVAHADERMEQHLRERFEHRLGTLGPATAATGRQAAATAAAQEIRNLLTRPEGIRQLIVASEILRRPEERWEH